MRLSLTSTLLALPLASLAALQAGAPGDEPTTTLSSTSTMTLTQIVGQATVTSTLAEGESTHPAESASSTPSSSDAAVVTSLPEIVVPSPVVSPVINSSLPYTSAAPAPLTTAPPPLIVSTAMAPYPIPGSSGVVSPSGGIVTAGPTGTGVPPSGAPPGIEPFQGAAARVGSDRLKMAVGFMVMAGLTAF
ncbi:MAG: hypothetical protein Q9173_006460 [Seirophora scorigena]